MFFNVHDRQITQFDHDRLWRLAGRAGERPAADDLEDQLDRTTVVPARQVPPDLITMNPPAAWVSCWSASCPAGDGGCG
jgi:hypothetical protein